MEFRLLGPLEVLGDDGAPIPLGGKRPRALLALLLLNANDVVSTDRLVDGVWGDQPPASAQSALQVHVHALRKALGADRIVTQAPGYLVRAEPEELDVDRFERLVKSGSAADLEQALGLWRGTASPSSQTSRSRAPMQSGSRRRAWPHWRLGSPPTSRRDATPRSCPSSTRSSRQALTASAFRHSGCLRSTDQAVRQMRLPRIATPGRPWTTSGWSRLPSCGRSSSRSSGTILSWRDRWGRSLRFAQGRPR